MFSVNYLANVPEVIDLARATKSIRPGTFVVVGGHSASFVAGEMIDHADGAIDCVVKGEGEASSVRLVEAAAERDPTACSRSRVDHRRRERTAAGVRRDSNRSGRPGTSCAIAASTSSACSTRARRSSSAAAAPGIARSAAPGRSTAGATG